MKGGRTRPNFGRLYSPEASVEGGQRTGRTPRRGSAKNTVTRSGAATGGGRRAKSGSPPPSPPAVGKAIQPSRVAGAAKQKHSGYC